MHLVEAAAELALADSLKSGSVRPIGQGDLQTAQGRHKASTLEWFATARNFAAYANEGGRFDDVVAFLRRHRLD
jgi:hypothetical protein